ncbi:hypothetical protein Tco_0876392 [Tanacetum coccineum]|uniref:Uncharacterized protein n=1 Tax=Tanacetum coccineum TaxID=301880 RepID=A0ABQ5BUY7_9ASTR
MVSATKDPITFDELMATPIDFSKNMHSLEGDRCPFDLTKPHPLKGHLGHLTVVAEYFFNNDLEFLKSSDLEKKYTTSITKTKADRYEIVGIEDMVPTLWSTTKVGVVSVNVKKLHGYGHLEDFAIRRADRQKSYHQTSSRGSPAWCRGCYQKKFNITAPHKIFPEIEFKVLYPPSYKPPGVIYKDLNKQNRVMQADEMYKFSNGTLKTLRDELHHRIRDFFLGYNKEMSKRKWTTIDKRRSELIVELIDKQMRERRIIRNLERLVGAWELEMDYKLMTQTE